MSLANFLLSLYYGYYSVQVGLLNVDGYYNSLLALFDNGVIEGFIKPVAREIVISAPTAKELMEKMEVSDQTLLIPVFAESNVGELKRYRMK